MKRLARKTNLGIALLLIFAVVLAGCGASAPSSKTTQAAAQTASQETAADDPVKAEIAKDPVTLIGYQFGDDTVDHRVVLDELNKKLEKDINTTVDLRGISWTDADKKYKLLFASGEEFDFAYAGAWIGYTQVATNNGYMEISLDMVQKYAPDTFAITPKDRWIQTMVKGKIYGLPNVNPKVKNVIPVFREDILKKYGIADIKNRTEFVDALLTIAKGEKDMLAWNVGNAEMNGRMRHVLFGGALNLHQIISSVAILGVDLTDPQLKVKKEYEMPEYLEYLKITKQLADAGVWSKSALASKDADETNFLNEKSACYIADELNTVVRNNATMVAKNPAYETRYVDVNAGYKKIPEAGSMSMICIHATSRHPERVMMMFNLLETQKEYFDLVTYGIAGTHYEPVGDNRYKSLSKFNDFGGFTMAWGVNNARLIRENESKPQAAIDLYNKYLAEDSIETPVATFTFDDSNVKNEQAAVGNVLNTYLLPIELALTDQEKGLAIMKEKLEAAGIGKIQAEVQAQLDAFVKEYNSNK